MEPVNRNEIMSRLKEQLANSPTLARSRPDPLNNVIPVDNPLEPEKGGFLKAYKDNFEPSGLFSAREFNQQTGELTPPFFNNGLKDEVLKLNIETGKTLKLSRIDIGAYDDFRVISLQTLNNLGVELKYPDSTLRDIQKSLSRGAYIPNGYGLMNNTSAEFYKGSYFQASIENGYLLSLDNIKDRDFVNALDNAAKAVTPKLSFDDAKYEPQFNKLEQYFEHLGIDTKPNSYGYQDHDVALDEYKISKGGTAYPYLHSTSWGVNQYPFKDLKSLPPPYYCKSENDFLRFGAHLITNSIIDNAINNYKDGKEIPFKFTLRDNAFMKNATNVATVKEIAGTMFAAQFGVPFTQNDVNRFNYKYPRFESTDFDDKNIPFYKFFKLATKVVAYARDLDVSKELSTSQPTPEKPSLWSTWKQQNEHYAMQMATPSIPQICKQYNLEVTRDNVITALNNLTNQKVNEVGQSKEPIKAALSQEQPINKELLNQTINSQSVEKSKGPQSKGLER